MIKQETLEKIDKSNTPQSRIKRKLNTLLKKTIITYTEGWNDTSFRFILHVTPSELKKQTIKTIKMSSADLISP